MAEPIMQNTDAPSSGWQPIQTAPETSADVSVWVVGGRIEVPTLLSAEGDYWRLEAAALPGSKRIPTLWHPKLDGYSKPEAPSWDLLDAHRPAVPSDEPKALGEARQTLEALVPPTSTPMVHIGFLRHCGGADNMAKADQIDAAIRAIVPIGMAKIRNAR